MDLIFSCNFLIIIFQMCFLGDFSWTFHCILFSRHGISLSKIVLCKECLLYFDKPKHMFLLLLLWAIQFTLFLFLTNYFLFFCCSFISLLVVYLVAGILFNKYSKGASGKELFPNVNFWIDFPFLVKVSLRH